MLHLQMRLKGTLLGISESTEHILNELEDLFQSLVHRMNKSEMEDFELVK